ncbi:16S rRNA pseudouridine(516) synthase RsuA [Microbulbifer spongiae]|uniref:Pseudouridine synthase n=1 Tax=Microbulbifer spongiae TaxID=2944933 RepID=A0ABY9E8F9_9GAMM|nr:16S rRNA pseudouridine(516) synthase RsuA [Microbulbifer sp. MI-G]WKD48393.1 16S rRNA pseudouridine(516) synthase RsuA [Microbulbifer sp. MI-G]
MASPIRLDKAVSQVTGLSRSDAKRAAKAQRISVNDQVVTDPTVKVQASDSLCLDGVPLLKPGPRYIMLNKPMGYVSATKDPKHPTVLDLIEEPNTGRLHIAGRLDIDTTGLVLLTDDGQWSHKVTSPNHHCAKTYHAQLADKIEAMAVAKFAKGIWLNSERRRTRPAKLQILLANEARVTIGEGRYHQVKRMFAALGNKVLALHREKIGDISLDETLGEGEYRFLTPDEIASVK